jgi:hypothetical protein
MTLLGVAGSVEDSVPNEDHRTLGERLSQDRDGDCNRFAHWLEYTEMVFGRHYSGRVDEDRLHVAIVVMRESQLQQTGLSCNSDADLIGEVKAATPLPVLLL